ncbi:hypothetical protein BB561_001608 [Smittium simulii]|uniref:Cationic amino acid transporter C-terminal domain-containing protein n=1 Tax=Smittium simulii TaxID=133385 RepID=A0A2T9YTU1_9FUNG|nr:hypothetical protein BB561_001608 [Smittium simulii]
MASKCLEFLKSLIRKKPLNLVHSESNNSQMKRTLGKYDLISLGIGCTIGSGIFVLTGQVAKDIAGPSVVLSFVVSAFCSSLTAFSYAELSTIIPSSGAAYSFIMVALGEIFAWIACCCIFLQYLVGAATIASGWGKYFSHLLDNIFKVMLPHSISSSPINTNVDNGKIEIDKTAIMNLPAFFIVLVITFVQLAGIKESAAFNNIIVVVKTASILFFVFIGIKYINRDNYSPFIPPREDDRYGIPGIFLGAQRLYMAFVGFDSVASASHEAINVKKDLPIGIVVSLFICTILYVAVAAVLCGVQKYTMIDSGAISKIFSQFSNTLWIEIIINLGALSGLTSAILVNLIAQSRVIMTVATDGLLPSCFARIHHKLKTPYWATLVCGLVCMILSSFFPTSLLADLASCGSLIVYFFVNISVLVLRKTNPEIERSYKVPFSPYLISGLGAFVCLVLLYFSEAQTKIRIGSYLAVVILIYVLYSRRKSKVLQNAIDNDERDSVEK